MSDPLRIPRADFAEHEKQQDYNPDELRQSFNNDAHERLQAREQLRRLGKRGPFRIGKPLLPPDEQPGIYGKSSVLDSALADVPATEAERLDRQLNEAAFRAGNEAYTPRDEAEHKNLCDADGKPIRELADYLLSLSTDPAPSEGEGSD